MWLYVMVEIQAVTFCASTSDIIRAGTTVDIQEIFTLNY